MHTDRFAIVGLALMGLVLAGLPLLMLLFGSWDRKARTRAAR